MSELKRIVENIRSVFAESMYPQDFLDAYDQMECLASHSGRETFLVRKKDTGETAIAKCYDRSLFPLQPDAQLLEGIRHPGLPRFFDQFQNSHMVCVVREYIVGETLSEYAAENTLTVKEICALCEGLCDILCALHGHTPPVIHRDLKPENVIVRPDGSPALIDFDISRAWKDGAGKDTVFFGTRGYAPPEQYGFGQTDCRADIYAFGVLLRWLLTGSTRVNPLISIPPGMQTVIDRCTAFSPEERYGDMGEVRQALKRARSGRRPGRLRLCLLLAAVMLAMLCAGFAAGRYTDWFYTPPAVVFSEPLIERAARLWIGKETGPLSADDLAAVTCLYIYGTDVYADPEEYYRQTRDAHRQGLLRRLDDLELFPNLEQLHIVNQGYMDVSGIAGLTKLKTVELKHMRISGVQPIANVTGLREVCLFDTGIKDASPLENCPWLENLDVGNNGIEDMKSVGSHPSLRSLGLAWNRMKSLDGIAQRLPKLESVTLGHGDFGDLSGLRECAGLETVHVTADQQAQAEALFAGTDVRIVAGD